MINEYKTRTEEIKRYFQDNNLDYSKINELGKCGNKDLMVLQYISREEGQKGLLNDKPAKVVLIIRKKGELLEFEQTEYTRIYL